VLWQLVPGQHSFHAEAVDGEGQVWPSPEVRIIVLE
jgi:hypothetical protein